MGPAAPSRGSFATTNPTDRDAGLGIGGDASATAKRVFDTVQDDAEGAILVFMPGLAEITETVTKLRASAALEDDLAEFERGGVEKWLRQ